jgi:hypothetical protein
VGKTVYGLNKLPETQNFDLLRVRRQKKMILALELICANTFHKTLPVWINSQHGMLLYIAIARSYQ